MSETLRTGTIVFEGGHHPYHLLRRQLSDESHSSLDPATQLVVILDAFRLDQHPALHRPAGDVELLDVRFLQSLVALLRAQPHDEAVLPNADEHVAAGQEADAGEHLL